MNTKIQITTASLVSGLLCSSCTVQQYSPVQKEQVINASGQSQREIYNKSRQWFSHYFVSGKSVVDYEDPQSGSIIGNGISKIGSDPFGIIQYNIRYTIRVDTKDGRFKVTTNVIEHTNLDNQRPEYNAGVVSKSRDDMASKHIQEVVNNLKNYVSSRSHSSNG